jgi:hypothetical protein
MGKVDAHKILVGRPGGKRPFEDLGLAWRIILKCTLVE